MNEFTHNLDSIKNILQIYKLKKNKLNDNNLLDEIKYLVKSNDKLVDTCDIQQEVLSDYIEERRKCFNLSAVAHIESLHRKNKLLNIAEDTEHVFLLNEYIKILVEEKSEQVDFLLSNYETSESFVMNGSFNLQKYNGRFFKWKVLVKVIIICILIFYTAKIISFFL
ncbi:uncharacterized protein VNE69_12077 [Vairimorpha necatrix]|uniref:Membrane protein n=1 Tax=Vairimorpha necatrix TaxID=6039 RepID=A0AAX4JGH0_9MICR